MTWRTIPLKRVASIRVSNVDKKSVDDETPVRLCNYTDVYYRNVINSAQDFMEATASPDQVVSFRLRTDDVIITKDSEAADDIGVPTYVEESAPDLVCGYHLALIRPSRQFIDGRFLFWAMSSSSMRNQLEVAATGITRFGLRTDAIGRTTLDLPSLSVQRAIADFLDTETARIDALIEKKRRTHSAIEERFEVERDHQVHELITTHSRTKVRRLVDGVEQGWSPSCEDRVADTGEWGVLKTSAVTGRIFRSEENKRLPDDLEPNHRWVVKDGDVLVARGSGSLKRVGSAKVAFTEGRKLMISDLIYRLVRPRMEPSLLAHCLNCRIGRIHLESSIRTDAGQTLKIRSEDLLNTPIPAVPTSIQNRALERIERKRRLATAVARRLLGQIDLLTEHRQALIKAAVTGEIGVQGAAAG